MKTSNSFQFNMRKNIITALKPCKFLESSSDLLEFYLHNPNPSQELIAKFAKEKGLHYEFVEKYAKEKERNEQTQMNIINMKYGIKYNRPAENLVREYENTFDNTFVLGLDLNEELIPKKRKFKQDAIPSNVIWKDVNPKIISDLDEYLSNDPKGIIEVKGMNTLVSLMKKETKLENKQYLLTILSNTTYVPAIDRFMHLQGTNFLSEWINEIKEKIEKSDKFEKNEKYPLALDILHLILNISNKLPITVSDLKISKIGKKINKLGKCITDKQIKLRCETMVIRWKKLISDLKEEKKTFKTKESKPINNVDEKMEMSNSSINVNTSNSTTNSYTSKTVYQSSQSGTNKITPTRGNEYQNSTSSHNSTHLYKKRDRREYESNYFDANDEKQLKRTKYEKSNHSSQNFKYNKDKNSNFKEKKNLKGILKKNIDNDKNSKKKIKIRWENDNRIEKVKIFKLTDEPNASEVTEEEFEKIQQEILKNPHRVFEDMRDMRSREINMEKENINKVREKSNKTKEMLYQMIPRLPFTVLYELKLDDNDFQLAESLESLEKDEIKSIIQKTFAVKYFRDSEIPECPKMTKEKLFNYVDVSIPKMINLKRSLDPEKVEETQKLNPQILHSLQSYIHQNKDKEPEKMHKILDILKNFAFQNNIINENFNFNTSQNLNICGVEDANVNMNFLHSATSNPNIFNSSNNINLNANINSSVPTNELSVHTLNNNTFGYNNEDKKNPYEQIEKRQFYNNVKPHNYRTKPCRNYNSSSGCSRADNCHFIHDTNVKSQENPIIKFNQCYSNNIPILNKSICPNDDFIKPKEDFNQQPLNNESNMNNSNNLLNLNNIVNPNLNLFNTNTSFAKGGPVNLNLLGNNKINYPNNNLPNNQFNVNPNNNLRNPMQMMNFPFNLAPMMQNGLMKTSNNMNFGNNIQNIQNMNKMNPNSFNMNNNNNNINMNDA